MLSTSFTTPEVPDFLESLVGRGFLNSSAHTDPKHLPLPRGIDISPYPDLALYVFFS